MDFTRTPIIESTITPKEGHKLAIRSTKVSNREEYLVESVEMISFGKALFFRSTEKPKPFLVPVSDYEVVEIREARMVFKNAVTDRSIKVGSGVKSVKGTAPEKPEPIPEIELPTCATAETPETRDDKQKDKRRNGRKHRGRKEANEDGQSSEKPLLLSTLLPPPTTLISDTISRYRENALFRSAFYEKKEAVPTESVASLSSVEDRGG